MKRLIKLELEWIKEDFKNSTKQPHKSNKWGPNLHKSYDYQIKFPCHAESTGDSLNWSFKGLQLPEELNREWFYFFIVQYLYVYTLDRKYSKDCVMDGWDPKKILITQEVIDSLPNKI